MTEYKKEFPFPILFGAEVPKNVLAEWLSVKAVQQYHVAGRRGLCGGGICGGTPEPQPEHCS